MTSPISVSFDICKAILDKNYKKAFDLVNTKDYLASYTYHNTETVLTLATKYEYYDIVKLIIDESSTPIYAFINVANDDGYTALEYAVKNAKDDKSDKKLEEHLGIIQLLLEYGATIKSQYNNEHNALIWASRYGHSDVVKRIIENKDYLDLLDKDGNNAIVTAASNKHYDIVKLLVLAKANVNSFDKDGNTALLYATLHDKIDMIKFLIDHRANVNLHNCHIITPLYYAAKNNNYEIVKLLISKGAGPNLYFYYEYDSPLGLAISNNNLGMVKLLVEFGANIRMPAVQEGMPIPLARHNKDIHTYLINHAIKTSPPSEQNSVRLYYSAYTNDIEAVKKYIDLGADINYVGIEYKNTTLMWAVKKGNVEMVKLLLEKGADPNIVDHHKITPLKYAADDSRGEIAELLRKHGAK